MRMSLVSVWITSLSPTMFGCLSSAWYQSREGSSGQYDRLSVHGNELIDQGSGHLPNERGGLRTTAAR